MKKIAIPLSAAFLISGLTGCNGDDAQLGNDYANPMTFQGNNIEEEKIFEQNEAYGFFDNNEQRRGDRFNRNIYYTNTDDFNYHGQMNTTLYGYPTRSYDEPTDYYMAQKMTDAVDNIEGVNEATVVIDGDQVYIGVDTNTNDIARLEQRIQRAMKSYADGREIQVITDQTDFRRMFEMNGQYGSGTNQFNTNIRQSIENINQNAEQIFTE